MCVCVRVRVVASRTGLATCECATNVQERVTCPVLQKLFRNGQKAQRQKYVTFGENLHTLNFNCRHSVASAPHSQEPL